VFSAGSIVKGFWPIATVSELTEADDEALDDAAAAVVVGSAVSGSAVSGSAVSGSAASGSAVSDAAGAGAEVVALADVSVSLPHAAATRANARIRYVTAILLNRILTGLMRSPPKG
tara:strand:- start:516 stop:863 length:348 start_codon:yes stop_codon:yes gene_type:complete